MGRPAMGRPAMEPSAADAREVTRVAPCSPMELRALMARGAPFVVSAGMLDGWAARSWTLETLAERFGDASVCVRLHPRDAGPVWEGDCLHVGVTLGDFCAWLSGASSCARLAAFPRATYVGYADYQDMVRLFADAPGALAEVDWASLGVARDGAHPGAHSTLWLGSAGAHTPCHYDTYGSNLVAELQGTKRWRLHPPTAPLVPSRVPYEESSVFATTPDAGSLDLAGSLEVDLRAGELLFVPKHWWHQVGYLGPRQG